MTSLATAVTTATSGATAANAAAASANAATSSAAATAARGIAGDMQTFLKLLTTQLRNQDPTKPLDPNELTQQLAQFSGVEQQIATNAHMEAMLGLQRSTSLVSGANLVGKQAEVTSSTLSLLGGAAQEVRVPTLADAAGATRARIAIANASGNVVREQVVTLGTTASGWSWDGKDARGRALSDGNYRLTVQGLDQEGAPRGTLPSVVAGTVTGVSQNGETVQLAIGALSAGFDSLRRIR